MVIRDRKRGSYLTSGIQSDIQASGCHIERQGIGENAPVPTYVVHKPYNGQDQSSSAPTTTERVWKRGRSAPLQNGLLTMT